MSAAWMLYALAIAGLLFGGAVAAEYVARAFARPTRFVWLVALAAATALPAASLLPSRDASETATTPTPPEISLSTPAISRSDSTAAPTPATPRLSATALERFDRPMNILSLVAPLLAITYLLLGVVRTRRTMRSLDEGTLDGHPVLLSRQLGPALLGLMRSRIVIPRWLLALPEPDRRIILTHEHQHADAHDPMLLATATILLALQPWNVFAWLLRGRLRLAIETDCDQRVLRVHGDARHYSRLLLAVYERTAIGGRMPRMAFVHRQSNLERRIRRVMERHPARSVGRNVAAVAATVLVAVVACEMPAPTARTADTTASGAPLAYSVVGVQPSCMRTFFEPDPTAAINRIRQAARERRPEAVERARTTRMVVALVLDENCAVTRDTAFAYPPNADGSEKLFGAAFPDITLPKNSVGSVWERVPSSKTPLSIVYAVIPSPALAARRARDECGFGIRFDEVCFASGPVVIRMMDSVRALVAVRQFGAGNKPADHVFLITLSRPNPALTSQSLRHGNITYHSGAVEISDFLTRDPPYLIAARDPLFLYDPSKETWRPFRLPPRELRRVNEIIGVAHYGSGWLTLEQIESLQPARTCQGARGACYQVGGRVIEFPA